jgi:hypothetical protein
MKQNAYQNRPATCSMRIGFCKNPLADLPTEICATGNLREWASNARRKRYEESPLQRRADRQDIA